MIKIATRILALALALALLCGCDSNSELRDLHVCGAYAVPGLFYPDMKGDAVSCEVIERDSYGRVLFLYTAPSSVSREQKTAHVICQQIKMGNVYYYEDICYILGEVTQAQINDLKNSNDWEKALCESKMVCRSNRVSYDNVIPLVSALDYGRIKAACEKEFAIAAEQIQELCYLDQSVGNQELLWLSVEENGAVQNYFLLVNPDYSICYEVAVGGDVDPKQVVEFKQTHGWEYVTQTY